MTPESRRSFIGASDWAHVMNEPPYGCQRQLWYEKTGTKPDLLDARAQNVLERGQRLEPLIIQLYWQQTGRRIHRGGKLIRHPDLEFIGLHLDGKIARHIYGGTPGVLECKTMGEFPFRHARRYGLPAGYILQVQGAMMVTGWAWGAFAVLWPDGWELEAWDFQRDDELIAVLEGAGKAFWAKIRNGTEPERLEKGDKRCRKCAWRPSCWQLPMEAFAGEEILSERDESIEEDVTFLPLITDLRDANTIAQDADETVEAIKDEIRAKMGKRDAVRGPGYRVYLRETKPQMKLDRKRLEKEFPKIAEKFLVPSGTSKPLRIYEMPQ